MTKTLFSMAWILSCLFILLGGCGTDSGGGSGGNVTVTVKSSTLQSRSASLTRTTDPSQGTAVTVNTSSCISLAGISYCACTVQNLAHGGTSINASGYCANPVEVAGGISSISLFRVARIPARILGGGMELATTRTGTLDVSTFDLKDASQMTGEDNVQDSSGSSNWEGVQVYFSHIDVKFPPVVISGITTYYTIRYVFYSQPLTSESVLQNCGMDSAGLANIEANGNFLSGLTFKRGDVLVCSKTASDECANSDFKFANISGAGSLVSTRPSSDSDVLRTSITDDNELDCSISGGTPDMNIGGMWMIGELAEQFNLTAAITGGVKTYTLTAASGSATSGTKLAAVVDFNVANMAFFNTSGAAINTWLNGSSLSTILQNTHFLPVYVRNELDSVYEGSSYTVRDSAIPVTATLTVE